VVSAPLARMGGRESSIGLEHAQRQLPEDIIGEAIDYGIGPWLVDAARSLQPLATTERWPDVLGNRCLVARAGPAFAWCCRRLPAPPPPWPVRLVAGAIGPANDAYELAFSAIRCWPDTARQVSLEPVLTRRLFRAALEDDADDVCASLYVHGRDTLFDSGRAVWCRGMILAEPSVGFRRLVSIVGPVDARAIAQRRLWAAVEASDSVEAGLWETCCPPGPAPGRAVLAEWLQEACERGRCQAAMWAVERFGIVASDLPLASQLVTSVVHEHGQAATGWWLLHRVYRLDPPASALWSRWSSTAERRSFRLCLLESECLASSGQGTNSRRRRRRTR